MPMPQVGPGMTVPIARAPSYERMIPVSNLSSWLTVHTQPEVADNSGSVVVNPAAIYAANDGFHLLLANQGSATTVLLRFKYLTSNSTPTSPVIQPFGADNANKTDTPVNWMRLFDGSASPSNILTLTIDGTNDLQDGTYSYTTPVEVDLQANSFLLVAINTAYAATGVVTASEIQAKLK